MEISLAFLEKSIAKIGSSVNFSIDTESSSLLIITKGKKEENGSNRIFLEFSDIDNILELNKITGENGMIKTELEKIRGEVNVNKNKRYEEVDDLIYDTLAKYIIQMLKATREKILFPEIIPLEKHKTFFKSPLPL